MTDGEGGDQYQNLLPIASNIDRAEGQHKRDVIIAIGIIKDVVFAEEEVELEFGHYFARS